MSVDLIFAIVFVLLFYVGLGIAVVRKRREERQESRVPQKGVSGEGKEASVANQHPNDASLSWFRMLLNRWRSWRAERQRRREERRRAEAESRYRQLKARLRDIPYMTGAAFEQYMAEVFIAAGYPTKILGGAGDQGVDLLLQKGSERVAVQCKNHRRPVGNPPVQQVFAGKHHHRANHAWVVAPAGFTKGAFALARSTGVLLFDYGSIKRLIQQAEQQAKEQQVSAGHITDARDRGLADSENKQQVSERSGPGETTGGTIRTRDGNGSQANATAKQESAKQELPPINFSGGGQMATEPFDLESGLAIFRLTHQGDEYFSATLMEQNGDQAAARDSLLASIVGPFNGSKAIETKAGQHVLDVQARAPWTIHNRAAAPL